MSNKVIGKLELGREGSEGSQLHHWTEIQVSSDVSQLLSNALWCSNNSQVVQGSSPSRPYLGDISGIS